MTPPGLSKCYYFPMFMALYASKSGVSGKFNAFLIPSLFGLFYDLSFELYIGF